jgi:transposase
LKSHLRTTVETLLARGESHREIERRTGVDRKTIRRYHRLANSPTPATGSTGGEPQTPPPRPPAPRGSPVSACEVHRPWIEAQLSLGRNATSLY